MKQLQYIKPTPILLKEHPQFNEAWLRDRIVEDPSILGLGDLEVKDIERRHPNAGRLDLLLLDPETDKRYEVEIMLGTVDESHIIRTIEYWDIERKRYPQYDHCAVLVAENITSRFLNVIGLFNSAIPIIAIQLNAMQVGDGIVLNFTKVLDEIMLGEDDEEDGPGGSVDRSYWEAKGSKESLEVADECLAILRAIKSALDVKYNKFYIGLTDEGRINNFVVFRPKKQFLRAEVLISDQEAWGAKLEEAGFVVLPSVKVRNRLKFRVTREDVKQNRELLQELFAASYREQQE